MKWQFEETRIYSADENGNILAEATFVYKHNGNVNIDHTYVCPHLRGRGVAGDMMAVVAKHLRSKGLKATATCSYAYLWLKRNKEKYHDIIANDIDSQNAACKINAKH